MTLKQAQEILNTDERILACHIIDEKGIFVSQAAAEGYTDQLNSDRELAQKWGAWLAVLIGLVRQFDSTLSEVEYLVIARKRFTGLIMPLGQYAVAGIVLPKGANAHEIAEKVRARTTQRSNPPQ